jgi:hypothetical protein
MRYLVIYRHAFSLDPDAWYQILSANPLGIVCEGDICSNYWDDIGAYASRSSSTLSRLSLKLDLLTVGRRTITDFMIAMDALSPLISHLSLDLRGAYGWAKFGLKYVQKRFGNVTSLQLLNVDRWLQSRALKCERWLCLHQLQKLTLYRCDFSFMSVSRLTGEAHNLKELVLDQCNPFALPGQEQSLALPRGRDFTLLDFPGHYMTPNDADLDIKI